MPEVNPSATPAKRICVYGAGAVGGYLAARLISTGLYKVCIVARGSHLEAIRGQGLGLEEQGHETIYNVVAADDSASLGPQDIVFVTLKSHSLPDVADNVRGMLAPGGHAVFVTNGITWWWPWDGNGGSPKTPMRVDPQRFLWDRFGAENALGCTIYSANIVRAPGKIVHIGNNRWIVGEPDNSMTPRLQETVQILRSAALNAEATINIRKEVWTKLLRNSAFNPLAALTRLGNSQFQEVPQVVAVAQRIIAEVKSVAAAQNYEIHGQSATEIAAAGGLTSSQGTKATVTIRASMLQDVLALRPLEVEAILGQVSQFAQELDVPTPTIDLVYALLSGLDLSLRSGNQ